MKRVQLLVKQMSSCLDPRIPPPGFFSGARRRRNCCTKCEKEDEGASDGCGDAGGDQTMCDCCRKTKVAIQLSNYLHGVS